jgi:hypothetical protein
MWAITDPDGNILAEFEDEWDMQDALQTGEYPEDAEPAYIN